MGSLLLNIDVSDIAAAEAFYGQAFGLRVGRRLGTSIVELLGFPVPLYLLEKEPGAPAFTGAAAGRDFSRHWTPVHFDVVVESIVEAVMRVRAAGARPESGIQSFKWGKQALFADPFGNGFCLVEFTGRGYDELVEAR